MAIAVTDIKGINQPVSIAEPVDSYNVSTTKNPLPNPISQPSRETEPADKTSVKNSSFSNFSGIRSGNVSVISSGGGVSNKTEISENQVEQTAEQMKNEGFSIAEKAGRLGTSALDFVDSYRWQMIAGIGLIVLILIGALRKG
jgi:hypothetical protein